jgi:hypothetical protein
MESPLLGLILDCSVIIAAERKRQTVEEFLTAIGRTFGEVEIVRLLPLALLWSESAALAGSDPALDFSRERAMGHVHALANLQSRTAGTSGESKAIQYVASKLRIAGLDVRTEPFEFTGFDLVSCPG